MLEYPRLARRLRMRGPWERADGDGDRDSISWGHALDFPALRVSDRSGQSIGQASQPAVEIGRRMGKLTTAGIWVKGVAEMLAAEGLDARALLLAAGIDPAATEVPGARLPDRKSTRLNSSHLGI